MARWTAIGDRLATLSPFLMSSCSRITNALAFFLLPLALSLRRSRATINRLRLAVFPISSWAFGSWSSRPGNRSGRHEAGAGSPVGAQKLVSRSGAGARLPRRGGCRVRSTMGSRRKGLAGRSDDRRYGLHPGRYGRSTSTSRSGVADSQFMGLVRVGRIPTAEEERHAPHRYTSDHTL